MPPSPKRSSSIKQTESTLLQKQADFRKAVQRAGAEDYFPVFPTDEDGELDNHTIRLLEVFAHQALQNRIPNEFERLADCPVCRYRQVAKLNEQAIMQGVTAKTLADLHAPLSEPDIRLHVNVCLTRLVKAAAGALPSAVEAKQQRTFVERMSALDDEGRELMLAARDSGDFSAAVNALKTRKEITETHGRATGEYQDTSSAGPQTLVQRIGVVYIPPRPQAQIPAAEQAEVIDVTPVKDAV